MVSLVGNILLLSPFGFNIETLTRIMRRSIRIAEKENRRLVSIIRKLATCSTIHHFSQLPDDIQHFILSLVINPSLQNLQFHPSHLIYAGVCKKWWTTTRSLVTCISLTSLAEILRHNRGYLYRKEMWQVPEFIASCKASLRSLIIDDRNNSEFNCLGHRGIVPNWLIKEVLEAASGIVALRLALRGDRGGVEKNIFRSIRMMKNLRTVSLSDFKVLYEKSSRWVFGDSMVFAICKNSPLESVFLELKGITDEAMKALGGLPSLKVFHFSNNYLVTDRGVNALCGGKGSLRNLRLYRLPTLTDKSALSIATGPATRKLKELYMSETGSITEEGLCQIVENCKQLSKVHTSFTQSSRQGMFNEVVGSNLKQELSVARLPPHLLL